MQYTFISEIGKGRLGRTQLECLAWTRQVGRELYRRCVWHMCVCVCMVCVACLDGKEGHSVCVYEFRCWGLGRNDEYS